MSRNEDIDNAIWSDPDFEALGPNATLLYLWSFTNPRCGMAGLYKVSIRTMAESKVPAAEIVAALDELSEANFAFYEDQVLWVRARVKRLRTKGPSIAKSIANDIGTVRPDHPLRIRFLDTYSGESWLRTALRDTLGPNPYRTPPEGREITHNQDQSLTPSTPPRGVPGQGHCKGLTRTTTNDNGKRNPARKPDQHALPADFPAELEPAAQQALSILQGVYLERGGNEPTIRSVGLSLRRFPKRDHASVARDLEHWTLAGLGQSRPLKDVGRLYATFLERAPDGAPMRPGSAGGFRPQLVEDSAAFLTRRGAA